MDFSYEEFQGRVGQMRALVYGDNYLDLNGVGEYVGNSRENPSIPVLGAEKITFNPGGAANLASNFPIETWTVGLWGATDIFRIQLERELQARKVNYKYMIENEQTGVFGKYYFPNGVHVDRVDIVPSRVYSQTHTYLTQIFSSAIQNVQPDLIFIADYDEVRNGICFPSILQAAREAAKESGVMTFGTSRKRLKHIVGMNYLLMNKRELLEQVPGQQTIKERVQTLLDFANCDRAIVTLEGNGASIFWRMTEEKQIEEAEFLQVSPTNFLNVPSVALKDVDSCGCGDTFGAYFATAITAGYAIQKAARIGNAAARAVARKRFGVGYPEPREIEREYREIEKLTRVARS